VEVPDVGLCTVDVISYAKIFAVAERSAAIDTDIEAGPERRRNIRAILQSPTC
jgi:hypothetical protein